MRPLPRMLTLAVLILWALVGPIGMAFDGCATMGGACEGPCAATTAAVMPIVAGVVLPLAEHVALVGPDGIPAVALAVPDLPPKPLLPA